MNKEETNETSLSNNENERKDMETFLSKSDDDSDTDLMIDNEQMAASNVIFQELLRKTEQVHNNQDDRQDRIRQGIALCSELMDIVEKTTYIDPDILQNCWSLLLKILLDIDSIVLVEAEKLFMREIFFALFDLLSKPQILSYINNDLNMKIQYQLFYKRVTDLLLQLAPKAGTKTPLTYDDIASRNYSHTLCAICKRANYDLKSGLLAEEPTDENTETTYYILSLFWNMAYCTVVVPWLLDIGLIKNILEWLKITRISSSTIHRIINIIHNITRHEDGVDEFKKFDGFLIVKSFQVIRVNDIKTETNLALLMTIVFLSTPEQIRLDNKRINKTLNQLLQIAIEASQNKEHLCHRGSESFHASAPLAVFAKLFPNDHSLEYVLNHAETEPSLTASETINLFVKLLIDFQDAFTGKNHLRQVTCTTLLEILWSISFHNRYKAELQRNENLLKTLKNLALDTKETIIDRYILLLMKKMTKAAEGILFNLDAEDDIIDTEVIPDDGTGRPLIMISYAHADKEFCDKILVQLQKKENKFQVWIDRYHVSSNANVWVKIASAIKQSTLVVFLLSENYFESRSCRKEAIYADKCEKSIIPVYIGYPGECKWLDIHIAGYTYVRFKNDSNELDREDVRKLIGSIQDSIKDTQTQSPQQKQKKIKQQTTPTVAKKQSETTKSLTFDMKKSPESWTVDEINSWFDSHKVPEALVKLFNFQSLAEMSRYASKLQSDSKTEFLKYGQRYAKNNAGEELEEYIFDRFKDSLLSLTNNYFVIEKTSMPSHQTSTSQSSICTIV